MTNVGDGLVMAEAVGAKNFDAPGLQLVYVSYDCYVGINEESGLIVTNKGERVVNEWSYQSHVAQALADAKSPAATTSPPSRTARASSRTRCWPGA